MKSGPDTLSKDQLVLATLAVLGGERQGINERDLFLACWHAFPSAMRWADTALPNPDTFTASLRRLDADGLIERVGKQSRSKRTRQSRRLAHDPGRSGVVRARLTDGALSRAGITRDHLALIRQLAPPPESYRSLDPAILIALCVAARAGEGRPTDEGALVEAAFHKFPAIFAYGQRPEFPDIATVRSAAGRARDEGLLTDWNLTDAGKAAVDRHRSQLEVRLDASASYKTGAFKLADRIESSTAFQAYRANGTLALAKADELFRALRLPPTADPRPIAAALRSRAKELRPIDRGEVVEYLLRLASIHNQDVLPLLVDDEPAVRALMQERHKTERK